MIVNLSKKEMDWCRDFAKERWDHCRSVGAKRHRFDNKKGGMDELVGLMGELAFAKIFKAEVNKDQKVTPYDFKIPIHGSVKTVDVKSTPLKYGNLLDKPFHKNIACDYYTLCIVSEQQSSVYMAGWVKGEDFFQPNNLKHMKYGKCYFVSREELNPIEDLLSDKPKQRSGKKMGRA
tara:strand:- start:20 stop:550 length:531 start_codon:yes stop_codon:yes gene_type:complete